MLTLEPKRTVGVALKNENPPSSVVAEYSLDEAFGHS
jgi:hypothetical protein